MKAFGVGILASVTLGLALSSGWAVAKAEDGLDVAMLLPGEIDDGGFMQAGYEGLMRIQDELGAQVSYVDKVKPNETDLIQALEKLTAQEPDLIIAHGGQNADAVMAVASDYPDMKFSVTQGHVSGANVSSYEMLQEESAWLAGAAAGLLTETNVVGHISGIRVPPGLKGRGAFHDGLKYTNPDARFLTTFAGDQDDAALAGKVVKAQAEEGVDIIFTMLNAGRTGAIEAMQELGDVKQFGNVRVWHDEYPEVFWGSAVADVGRAGFMAAEDVKDGSWESGKVVSIGLENEKALRLALAPTVPEAVKSKVDELARKIVDGDIDVVTTYDGPEFDPQ